MVECNRAALARWNELHLKKESGDSFRSAYLFKFDGIEDFYSIEVDMRSYLAPIPLNEWHSRMGF